jgi:hypothetical protein
MISKGTVFSIVVLIVFIISVSYLDLSQNPKAPEEFDESSFEALSAPTNSSCYSCHTSLQKMLDGSISKSAEDWQDSIHYSNRAVIMCSNCHGGNASTNIIYDSMYEEGGYIANYSKEKSNEICGRCHQEEYNYFLESVHWTGADNNSKLRCGDCHSIHGVLSTSDPESPVFLKNIPKTCGKCHSDEYKSYGKTFHGKTLNFGSLDVAVCTNCHSSHYILPESNPNSTTYPINLQKACSECHNNDLDLKISEGFFHDKESLNSPNLLFDKDELNDKEKKYYFGPLNLGYYIPLAFNVLEVLVVFSLITIILFETIISRTFRRGLNEQ